VVDASTADDAAVYRLDDERALVATADFFTPIVDDPYDFGRIAAANALSDVYAVGARPLFALNLVGFPRALLSEEGLLSEILRGGGEVAAEAGIPVVGGHSVDDPEPKFGMCVVGEVHPDRIVRNSTARVGDVLVLTKAIGTGIITTAAKADAAPAAVLAGAVESMRSLNRAAAEAMVAAGAHAATDVTGFGLLGHLTEMMRGAGLTARIAARAVPVLAGALELIAAGHVPGGTVRNLRDLEAELRWSEDVPDERRTLLADAQTSGGLLISLPAEAATVLLDALGERAAQAAVIGEVIDRRDVAVVIDRE
jgi:selenide,water dikinase